MIIVDKEDEWLLHEYQWSIEANGYAVIHSDPVIRLHHCVVGMPIDPDIVIDHIDRNKLNNRRANLRYTTRTNNYLNSKRSENATYIYKQGWNGRFYVDITRERQRYYGGTHDTFEQATEARNKLLKEIEDATRYHER